MAIVIAISCTKTYFSPRTTIIVNGYVPYYGWNIPTNDKGECGIFFGNYVPSTKASSVNGKFVGPNECGYDSFNVFAFKDGEVVMNPYLVSWNGEIWSYESTSQELQYFDKNSNKYDFIGVIADNAINNNGTICVNAEAFMDNSNEMNTEKEVLYSITTVEKENYNAPVSIDFQHVNSKMYLGFASDRADTKIIDYAASSTIVNTITKIVAPVNRYGIVTSSNFSAARVFLTDEVIAAFNAKCTLTELNGDAPDYTSADPWGNINSTKPKKIVTGDLNSNRWSEISSLPGYAANLFNNLVNVKADYARPVHIEVVGNEIMLFYVANVDHANAKTTYDEETVTTGLTGIRVFSVNKENDKLVRANHTTEALVSIKDACDLSVEESSAEVLEFTIPSGNVAQFANKEAVVVNEATLSPSVYYALPVGNPEAGYVVKFSYTYNGTNYYDARVNIPAVDSNFAQGCYYKYVIFIGPDGNGTTDPDIAIDNKDEVDTTEQAISFSVVVSVYNKGKEVVYQL